MNNMLEGMIKTKLQIIRSNDGSVLHGMKKIDPGYKHFGELYFSTVKIGHIKAWKLHNKMTCNLMVPNGEILFGFFDTRLKSKTYKQSFKIIVSEKNYCRLTIPPKIWFGFKGLGKNINIICNMSDIIHSKHEIERKKLDEIKFDWSI